MYQSIRMCPMLAELFLYNHIREWQNKSESIPWSTQTFLALQMISYKTIFALALIAIDALVKASASGTDPVKSTLAKKQRSKSSKRTGTTLRDMTSTVVAVQAEGESTLVLASPQEQLVPLANKQFEELIDQENYEGIVELGKDMTDEEFLRQLCPVVETLAHYNGLYECLKSRKMVPGFFVHGSMEVVKEVIAEIRDYDTNIYIHDGDLEVALPLAFKEDEHGRAIELFVARQARTAKADKQGKQGRYMTSF